MYCIPTIQSFITHIQCQPQQAKPFLHFSDVLIIKFILIFFNNVGTYYEIVNLNNN